MNVNLTAKLSKAILKYTELEQHPPAIEGVLSQEDLFYKRNCFWQSKQEISRSTLERHAIWRQ